MNRSSQQYMLQTNRHQETPLLLLQTCSFTKAFTQISWATFWQNLLVIWIDSRWPVKNPHFLHWTRFCTRRTIQMAPNHKVFSQYQLQNFSFFNQILRKFLSVVYNLRTSHIKHTFFTLNVSKNFSAYSALYTFLIVIFVGFHLTLRFPTSNINFY